MLSQEATKFHFPGGNWPFIREGVAKPRAALSSQFLAWWSRETVLLTETDCSARKWHLPDSAESSPMCAEITGSACNFMGEYFFLFIGLDRVQLLWEEYDRFHLFDSQV